MKFIGDDREEEEELMTWIISMLKYAFVLKCYYDQILDTHFFTFSYTISLS